MKKIFASVGMVALGAAAVNVASAADQNWSVSASLRGFYDDNYTTAPKGAEEDSFGVVVTPSVGMNLSTDQTTLSLKYTFGAYWYQQRQSDGNDAWDLTHQFDALLAHAFSQRLSVDVTESFVMSQEPALLDPTGLTTNPYRVDGDNIRNYANATLTAQLAERWSAVLGYANTYYNYDFDNGANESLLGFLSNGQAVSRSASNDRLEHLFLINLRWQVQPETTGVIGYNFGMKDYTSDEIIGLYGINPVYAETRNSRSHYLYAGVDHNFSRELSLSVRLGAQDADFYNDPTSNTDITPYGDISLAYSYRAGSSLRVGITHMRSHTDVIAIDSSVTENALTSDQETTVVYANLTHAFTPKLRGMLSASWQDGTYDGGIYDSQGEQFIGLSAGLSYRFTRHLSGDASYSFTTLKADVPGRDYDRNRINLGVTATY